MLMKTDEKLLRQLEIVDLFDKPSLERLAYLLRHTELWPKDFVWDFASCESCAMGLAVAFWQLSTGEQMNVDCYYGAMVRAFGPGLSHIFLSDAEYSKVPLWMITPEMVAGKIDEYLKLK